VPRARALTAVPWLIRLDSGHAALATRVFCTEQDVDFIREWNPRKESPEQGLHYAEAAGHGVLWESPRPGKRGGTSTVYVESRHRGETSTCRRVMRVTERTVNAQGQRLPVPEVDIEGGGTARGLADANIIHLYEEHATREQFHSECKTDLDIERQRGGEMCPQRPGAGEGRFGVQPVALHGARRSYRPAGAGAPSRQASAPAHGDAGAEVPGRTRGQSRASGVLALWPALSGVSRLLPGV